MPVILRNFQSAQLDLTFLVIQGKGLGQNQEDDIRGEEGGCTCVKEVLGCTVVMDSGTVSLLDHKCQELLALLEFLASQRHIGQKDMDHLIGKLCYIRLSVLGERPISTIYSTC